MNSETSCLFLFEKDCDHFVDLSTTGSRSILPLEQEGVEDLVEVLSSGLNSHGCFFLSIIRITYRGPVVYPLKQSLTIKVGDYDFSTLGSIRPWFHPVGPVHVGNVEVLVQFPRPRNVQV